MGRSRLPLLVAAMLLTVWNLFLLAMVIYG
jgi:hypothetical protein